MERQQETVIDNFLAVFRLVFSGRIYTLYDLDSGVTRPIVNLIIALDLTYGFLYYYK